MLAQSLGVSLDDLSECLASTALNAPWALAKLGKIEHKTFDPEFSLALATKDLHLALDAAARANRDLPIAKTIGAQWDDALRAGLGNRDVAGAYLHCSRTVYRIAIEAVHAYLACGGAGMVVTYSGHTIRPRTHDTPDIFATNPFFI